MKAPSNPIAWWEIRRIPFNVMLLVLGLGTLMIVDTVGGRYANPGEDVEEPFAVIFGVIAYAVAANICYTLGWIADLLLLSNYPVQIREAYRAKLFWAGIIFSACLTLLPAIVLPLLWAIFGFQHSPE